jgi:hypothetical protein
VKNCAPQKDAHADPRRHKAHDVDPRWRRHSRHYPKLAVHDSRTVDPCGGCTEKPPRTQFCNAKNIKAIFMKRGITKWMRIMNPCARMAIEIMKQPSPQAPIAICILRMLHGRLCHINESEDAPCSVCFPRSLIHRRAMLYSRCS